MRLLSVSLFRLEAEVSWTARLLTVLLVGVVLAIYIGVGGVNPLKLKGIELTQMAFFWLACIGMALAWRWQVLGGAISLGGMILLFAVELAANGRLPRGSFLYLMLLPGVLFLVSSAISRHRYFKAWSLFG